MKHSRLASAIVVGGLRGAGRAGMPAGAISMGASSASLGSTAAGRAEQRRGFTSGIWAAFTGKTATPTTDDAHMPSRASAPQAPTPSPQSKSDPSKRSEKKGLHPQSNGHPKGSSAPAKAKAKTGGASSQQKQTTAAAPSAFAMAALAGRKAARSPLFETGRTAVAVEAVGQRPRGAAAQNTAAEVKPLSGSVGGAPTATAPNISFSFPAKQVSEVPNSGRNESGGDGSAPQKPRTIVITRQGGDIVGNGRSGAEEGGPFAFTEPIGAATKAPSPYREGVFDANGQPVLTREALVARRMASSTAELKAAIAQIVPPTLRKQARSSSVRYKTDVRQGQHRYTMELMKVIRATKDPSLSVEEAIHKQCDFLNARERLDLLRMAARSGVATKRHKRINKKSSTPTKRLPMYFSPEFKKKYYFQEEDVTEKSALGHGPGGQAANRRKQTIHIKHIPTGIAVRYSHFPSLYANRKAARTILSLRVEQRVLGDESALSRMAAARNEKRARAAMARRRLEDSSAAMDRKTRHRHPFLGFLNGMVGMSRDMAPRCEVLGTSPSTVASSTSSSASAGDNGVAAANTAKRPGGSLARPSTQQSLSVSAFLDTYANRWWNILSESFYNHWCRPPMVRTFVRTTDSTMATRRRVCGWSIGATYRVPGWFCYFFPLICRPPTPLRRPPKEVLRLANEARRRELPPPPSPDMSSAVPQSSTFVSRNIGAPLEGEGDATVVSAATATAAVVEGAATSPTTESTSAAAPQPTTGAEPEAEAEAVVAALITEEAAAAASLADESERAKSIFFEYLRQKKKFDVVARTLQYHEDQLAQMRALPEGRRAVLSAVNAVVEVFGLRVVCGSDVAMGANAAAAAAASNHQQQQCFAVRTDGPNWRMLCERLCTPDRQHVTPLGAAVFPHMIASLGRLGMQEEAAGLKAFFVRRAESGKRHHHWAVEMVSLIEEAEGGVSADEVVVTAAVEGDEPTATPPLVKE